MRSTHISYSVYSAAVQIGRTRLSILHPFNDIPFRPALNRSPPTAVSSRSSLSSSALSSAARAAASGEFRTVVVDSRTEVVEFCTVIVESRTTVVELCTVVVEFRTVRTVYITAPGGADCTTAVGYEVLKASEDNSEESSGGGTGDVCEFGIGGSVEMSVEMSVGSEEEASCGGGEGRAETAIASSESCSEGSIFAPGD